MNLNEIKNETLTLKIKKINRDLISNFANLTGDKNRIHLDDNFASLNGFKSLISHGMLSLSLIIGAMYEAGLFEGIIVIFSDMMSVRFIKPVYPGTNLSARLNVKEKYASRYGNGIHIIIHVTGFETETNTELISFEAKFKIVPEHK
jgi:3-hydroxybutyryl-CoA dehydratase